MTWNQCQNTPKKRIYMGKISQKMFHTKNKHANRHPNGIYEAKGGSFTSTKARRRSLGASYSQDQPLLGYLLAWRDLEEVRKGGGSGEEEWRGKGHTKASKWWKWGEWVPFCRLGKAYSARLLYQHLCASLCKPDHGKPDFLGTCLLNLPTHLWTQCTFGALRGFHPRVLGVTLGFVPWVLRGLGLGVHTH